MSDQTRGIFEKFKELHPNNREEFDPSEANVSRWVWHIEQREKMPVFPEHVFERVLDWEKYLDETRAKAFGDMPRYVQNRYLYLTTVFRGEKVYACGSRVSGGWVDRFTSNEIRELRKMAGKPDKEVSDFDFIVEGVEVDLEKYNIPDGFDWLKYDPGPKIEIPMWDFTKLPETEHGKVVDALERRDERTLLILHDQYRLSEYSYCCNLTGVVNHFVWAVEVGIIKTISNEGDAKKVD